MLKKFKIFINYEKEEKWLNDMIKQGYELVSKNLIGQYLFRKIEPTNKIIRIDYHTFKYKRDYQDYCSLFEDSGWNHIVGSKNSGTHYFISTERAKGQEIFSDQVSKAGRYKRLSKMCLILSVAYFPIFIALISTGSVDVKALLNPKLLYYTPGLWEMSGATFWVKFLFETPFALMRGFMWLFIPIGILAYLFMAYKAWLLHKEQLKSKVQ